MNNEFIERPFLKDFCEHCANHYLLDGEESRCKKIKLGQSYVMCAQVVRCDGFQEIGELQYEKTAFK